MSQLVMIYRIAFYVHFSKMHESPWYAWVWLELQAPHGPKFKPRSVQTFHSLTSANRQAVGFCSSVVVSSNPTSIDLISKKK